MRAMSILMLVAFLGTVIPAAAADDDRREKKAAAKKKELDEMSDAALKELFATSSSAKQLYDKAYGYAAFSVIKVAIGITGGGGEGVAVATKHGGQRTYMEMGTGGIGVGLGGQKYRIVFLFETKAALEKFILNGWAADAEANAAAGTEGANAAATFSDGVAIYQMTKKGLLASADISGTKYWVDEDLNSPLD